MQAAKGSATTIAAAAGKNTTHENTAVTFLRDYYVDNAVTLFTDPGEFIVRYLYYAKGVGRAAKDAIVDLAVLGYEIGDTGAEAIEVAINTYTGTNTNITGKENVSALGNIGNKAAILLDFDDPEGARIAQEAMAKGESVIDALDRRYEKMAGQGKVGIRKALEDTGYVTGTVLAPEEALARAAGAALLTKVKGLDDLGRMHPRHPAPGPRAMRRARRTQTFRPMLTPGIPVQPAARRMLIRGRAQVQRANLKHPPVAPLSRRKRIRPPWMCAGMPTATSWCATPGAMN